MRQEKQGLLSLKHFSTTVLKRNKNKNKKSRVCHAVLERTSYTVISFAYLISEPMGLMSSPGLACLLMITVFFPLGSASVLEVSST